MLLVQVDADNVQLQASPGDHQGHDGGPRQEWADQEEEEVGVLGVPALQAEGGPREGGAGELGRMQPTAGDIVFHL